MRKRMETEERDATSRASFKCPSCLKTFTDLEVNMITQYKLRILTIKIKFYLILLHYYTIIK